MEIAGRPTAGAGAGARPPVSAMGKRKKEITSPTAIAAYRKEGGKKKERRARFVGCTTL